MFGWTPDNYTEYLRIRQELKEKCKEAYNKNWEDSIDNIIEASKDSKTFWNKIKKLKGKDIIHTNYMKDEEGNKYYSDKEKCKLMENSWKDIFRIKEEEEANFDVNHSEHVNGYINVQQQKITPFSTTNLNRLENDSIYTRKIDRADIARYLKKI